MRIHTDHLTFQDLWSAAPYPARVEELDRKKSRKRDHAFEVKLSGSSPYAAQGGQWKAARWDEWGIFLATLFDAEPTMIAGQYDGRDDFIDQTTDVARRGRAYAREGQKGRDYLAPWLTKCLKWPSSSLSQSHFVKG